MIVMVSLQRSCRACLNNVQPIIMRSGGKPAGDIFAPPKEEVVRMEASLGEMTMFSKFPQDQDIDTCSLA